MNPSFSNTFGENQNTISLIADASEDLQTKSKRALKNVLQKCVHLSALEPLLHDAPANILKHVVGQFSKVWFALKARIDDTYASHWPFWRDLSHHLPHPLGTAAWPKSSPSLCHFGWTKKSPRNQDGARNGPGRVYQRHQWLLPRGNCQVLFSRILRTITW